MESLWHIPNRESKRGLEAFFHLLIRPAASNPSNFRGSDELQGLALHPQINSQGVAAPLIALVSESHTPASLRVWRCPIPCLIAQ
jgi:hypothetical protein